MVAKAKTTERSIQIIEEIQRKNGSTLVDLNEELEIARSTIHRHLQTLIEHGYITREGETYHVDLKFLNLGEYAQSRKFGYRLTEETVYELSDQTNEECEFLAENVGYGILVHESYHPESQYKGTGKRTFKDSTAVGTYFHLHECAAGKAILADLPDQQVEEIVEQRGLPPKTDKTITTMDELWEELEKIREQGIAYTDGEFARGLREVARRVKSPNGNCLGAIAVLGPTYRMTDSKVNEEIPKQLEKYISDLETKIKEEYLDDFK